MGDRIRTLHNKILTGNIHSMCKASHIVHDYMSQGWRQGKQLEEYIIEKKRVRGAGTTVIAIQLEKRGQMIEE